MSENQPGNAPESNPQNIQLEQIEREIYARQHEKAARLLLKVLQDMDIKRVGLVVPGASLTSAERGHQQLQLLSRFSGCISALLADPEFKLSQPGFEMMIGFKRFMTAVFMGSGYGDMNHLIALVGQRVSDGKVTVSNDMMLRKLLLVLSPSGPLEKFNILQLLEKLPAQMSVPFWMSFVDPEIVLGQKEAEHRRKVAMLYEQLPDDYVLPDLLLARATNAWMFLSYLDFREKHQPKRYINRLLRRWAESKGVKAPTVVRREVPPGEKPRLLIPIEHFRTRHAMFRVHSPNVEALRKFFYLSCLAIDTTIDDDARELFDEVITIKADEAMRDIAGKVVKQKPDMIWYPSLGMQNFTVVLAQFRFAPVQIMSMGHPATSMAPDIDYVITSEQADPDLHSERILYGQGLGGGWHKPFPGKYETSKIHEDNGVVVIGVNAKNYKINYRLIQACLEIQSRAEKEVEFRFFPNAKGITYEAFRVEMSRYMNALTYPGTDYATYMDRLRRCDLILNPFPFGNTNGINDCAKIGLPLVCMGGDEIHSTIDLRMTRALGYPDLCRTTSLEEYIDAAIRMIDDPNLRTSVIENVVYPPPARNSRAGEPDVLEPGEGFLQVLKHHDAIQKTADRKIDVSKLG